MTIPDRRIASCDSTSGREHNLKASVEALLPQVDEIHVYLNGYDEVPTCLNHSKIIVRKSQDIGEMGINGKLYPLKEISPSYFFLFDDTHIYPPDYVDKYIECMRKYKNKVLVTGYGSVFAHPLKWYYHRYHTFEPNDQLDVDRFVTLGCSGSIAFHTQTVDIDVSACYSEVYTLCEPDLLLSIQAKKQSIPVVSIKRERNWLTRQNEPSVEKSSGDIDNVMTLATPIAISEGHWDFATYADFVIPHLHEIFGNFSNQDFERLAIDTDFVAAAADGGLPWHWGPLNSHVYPESSLRKLKLFADLAQNPKKSAHTAPPLKPIRIPPQNKLPTRRNRSCVPIYNDVFVSGKSPSEASRVSRGNDPVIASVASFPKREQALQIMTESILPQVDQFHVYLNNYEYIPSYLDNRKITVYRSQDFKDLSAMGKMYALDKVGTCYYFSLDDDNIYPHDYVSKSIDCINKYNKKVAVTVHGSIFSDPIVWYYHRYTIYPYQHRLETDRFVSLPGSGTLSFHTDTINATFSQFCPFIAVDLIFAILARNHKVPIVSIARPKSWIQYLKFLVSDGLWEQFREVITIHTLIARDSGPWDYRTYADFTLPIIEDCFGDLTETEMAELKLDIDFIMAARKHSVPLNWSSRGKSHRTTDTRRKRFFLTMAEDALAEAENIRYKEIFADGTQAEPASHRQNTEQLIAFYESQLSKAKERLRRLQIASDREQRLQEYSPVAILRKLRRRIMEAMQSLK